MEHENTLYYYAFSGFCFSSVMQRMVLAYFSNVKDAVLAPETEWKGFLQYIRESQKGKLSVITKEEEDRILHHLKQDHLSSFLSIKKKGISFVTEEDTEFPGNLYSVCDHPHWLFYYGELPKPEEPLLSIIGARKCTPYGAGTARCFARELAGKKVSIVSGLAYGVDRAAHVGALDGGGKTYGILGNGIDICYPQTNFDIFEKIRNGNGGLLSEYPPGTNPLPCFFPQRNRIIASIADGILVTEARKKSGTLITVAFGLEYGKNIFAVPGRITDPLSEGCNQLLSEGAKPVLKTEDILTDMEWEITKTKEKERKRFGQNFEKNENSLASPEKIVYASLRLRPKHMEELLVSTGLLLPELSAVLHGLCVKGYVNRIGQALYAVSGEEKEFLPER